MAKLIYEVNLTERPNLILTLEIYKLDGEREIDVPYSTPVAGIKSFFKDITQQEDLLRVERPIDAFEALSEYVSTLTEYGEDDGEDDSDAKYVEGTFLAGNNYFEVNMRYDEDMDFGPYGKAAIVDALAAIVDEVISKNDKEGLDTFKTWQDSVLKELAEH